MLYGTPNLSCTHASPWSLFMQREFALKHLPDYAPFKLVSNLYEVVPQVLLKTGKVRMRAR